MKRLLLAFLLIASPALADTYVSEHETISDGGYNVIGNGINYESAPGVFSPTNEVITDGAGTWSVTESAGTWAIDKSTRTMTIGRGDKEIEFTPKGVYYVDKADWDIAKVGDLTAPSISMPDTKTVRLDGIFPNVNMVVYSKKQGPRIAYEFTTKVGYPSAASLGMDPLTTWVGVVHEITGANQPVILADEQAPNWGGTDASALRFVASKDHHIVPSRAVDANGAETEIRNFLVDKAGKKYFVETVKYAQFLAATFPVEFRGYTEVFGALAADKTYSGEYYVSGYITPGANVDVNIDPSTVFKVDPAEFTLFYHTTATATITASGPTDFGSTMIRVTSCDDQSISPNTSAEAECDSTPGEGDQGAFIYMTSGGAVDITGVEVAYGGDANYGELLHTALTGTSGNITIDSCLVLGNRTGTFSDATIHGILLSGPTYTGAIAISNTIISVGGNGIQQINSGAAGATTTIDNILVVGGAWGLRLNESTGSVVVRNVTGADLAIAINIDSGAPEVYDSYATANTSWAMDADASFPAGHTHNNSHGNSTNYHANWAPLGTGEISSDALIGSPTGHTDGALIPSWCLPYHGGVGGANINAGSRTSALAGLDTYHTAIAGTVDDGVVDIGFHYPGGGAAPDPGGGGNPKYMNPFGVKNIWDRERL